MLRYIFSHLLQATFALLVLSLAVFLSVRATGDPVLALLGPEASTEQYAQVSKNLGFDQPLIVQFGSFLLRVVQGDFGRSISSGQPVGQLVMQRFPATLELAGAAIALTVLVGVPLGVLSAVKRDSFLDTLGKFIAVLGIAAPNFWVAIMLILLFGVILGWLPTFGRADATNLILPAFVLALASIAGMMRLVRSSMLEILGSEYVRFARIKGIPEWLVISKHALKNAVIPALTFGGLTLAGLLNGAVTVEVVFAWPGIGRLMLEAIQRRDFPVVQATVLLAGFFYIALALIVDILYAYLDPRVRYS